LAVDTQSGIVTNANRSGGLIGGPWTATYVAGRSVVASKYVQAAKETLWDLWAITQRGATTDSNLPELVDVVQLEPAVSVPSLRVLRILESDRLPGFA
jgi:hypothetical protein